VGEGLREHHLCCARFDHFWIDFATVYGSLVNKYEPL
jgi:hypothetical protein